MRRMCLYHHLAWCGHKLPWKKYRPPTVYCAPSWWWAFYRWARQAGHSVVPKKAEAPLGQVNGGEIVLLAARIFSLLRVDGAFGFSFLDLSLDIDNTNVLTKDENDTA